MRYGLAFGLAASGCANGPERPQREAPPPPASEVEQAAVEVPPGTPVRVVGELLSDEVLRGGYTQLVERFAGFRRVMLESGGASGVALRFEPLELTHRVYGSTVLEVQVVQWSARATIHASEPCEWSALVIGILREGKHVAIYSTHGCDSAAASEPVLSVEASSDEFVIHTSSRRVGIRRAAVEALDENRFTVL